jgi:ribosomal protein L11 methyltransferase
VIVVVAGLTSDADAVADELRRQGATEVAARPVGRGRILYYGGPFADTAAVWIGAELRALGWTADVRPEGGGHLAAWHRHTAPTVIAERLWVCFPWSEFDRDEAELMVEVDPGRAFGTGSHPTTRLLLTELVQRIQGGERVLDLGCGSGVLGIAAAMLGARSVTAIDLVPVAIASTTANARRNGVADQVTASMTPMAEVAGDFDVILANVDAATLMGLAPAIQRCVAPHGWLGLSGLSPAQASLVAASYRQVRVVASSSEDDWSAIVATRA